MGDGGHAFTGVTGKIVVAGSVEGYVNADFKLGFETDMYTEQGNNVGTDHTFGMKSVDGKITGAWGVKSASMYDWFDNQEYKNIVFYPNATLLKAYTCSGCILTDMGSGIKAGDKGALMMDSTFKGLDWSSSDT